jgi:hypothetical protein
MVTTSADAKTDPRRPTVELSGEDGNAFSILGRVAKALRRAGYSSNEVEAFYAEAKAGDYDHLLRVCMAWVEVE